MIAPLVRATIGDGASTDNSARRLHLDPAPVALRNQCLLSGQTYRSLIDFECPLYLRRFEARSGFHVDHQEFNGLFDEEFARPLIGMGFGFVGQSKSIRYQNGTRDLWIKRISGKWPHPGVARTAICFRHSFLRPVSSDDPNSLRLIVDDFPRKLTFEHFDGWRMPRPKYRPENSGRWSTSEFNYGEQTPDAVRKRLRKMRDLVKTRILPWVNSLTEDSELSQITRYGEQAWCEKRWIDDYRSHIIANGE